jgi:imidazolonepropionase-like amidohydrolase
VLDDDTLAALVAHAHTAGTTVVAHTEGAGQAARAFAAGVDRLAHTPWSERLDDDLLEAMAGTQQWVSTLDIHGWGSYGADFATAQDNLRRFHALGGTVVYGTDLGNGALPVGINVRELRALQDAGLDDDDLVRSIAGGGTTTFGRRISFIAGERPADVPGWLARASVLGASDILTNIEERFA